MIKSTISSKKDALSEKWVALEDDVVIADGIDLSEVYTNAMIISKVKPEFKKISSEI